VADLILFDVNIITMDPAFAEAKLVAIKKVNTLSIELTFFQ
jgi:hypothetical protein